ncbi:formate dehydrogenase subunit delta [Phaeovulum sp.]|uniref:formate dehydrogenase subunit delta n=1 Tax=Phaeovulum sp. TaxID=2934796 RepID=UPI0035661752
MSDEKLAHMANQIAAFFATQPGTASEGVAKHINDNWPGAMRAALLAEIAAGGEGLAPEVIAAAPQLRPPAETARRG